ncbi:hypothetical protein CG709_05240 [Lachnotalea glycerini]|nr:hypothetical protein CG709_05240 [Lachnotalea glycerini]
MAKYKRMVYYAWLGSALASTIFVIFLYSICQLNTNQTIEVSSVFMLDTNETIIKLDNFNKDKIELKVKDQVQIYDIKSQKSYLAVVSKVIISEFENSQDKSNQYWLKMKRDNINEEDLGNRVIKISKYHKNILEMLFGS